MKKDDWNRYHDEWDRNNTVRVSVKLNRHTDADIIERLETVESRNGYIRRLVRDDILRSARQKQTEQKPAGE